MTMLIFIGCGALLGVISALCGKWLDSLMDYGSLLGSVRYRLAMMYAHDLEGARMVLESALNVPDYGNRMEAVNEAYWNIASQKFWFTGWICLKCLAERVACLVFLSALPSLLKNGADIGHIFVIFITTVVVCHFTIEKT